MNLQNSYIQKKKVSQYFRKMEMKGIPLSFEFEITARCNNNCRHCCINRPPDDRQAKAQELSVVEIEAIAAEAVSIGANFCLLTGGEPLVREDFTEIYTAIKRRGMIISLFTNACLITKDHIDLFSKYRPNEIEVTVYGITEATYEKVTRTPGSFAAFRKGTELLLNAGFRVRFKTMALRSNVHELPGIARFGRRYGQKYFRYDPMLSLRLDGDEKRNTDIRAERLDPDEIAAIEHGDRERFSELKKHRCRLIFSERPTSDCRHIFRCGAGDGSFAVSYDGRFRLCLSLCDDAYTYDLRRGTLNEAYYGFVPQIRNLKSDSREYMARCGVCSMVNLCYWCPAHAYLESGILDLHVDYFCEIAKKREAILNKSI